MANRFLSNIKVNDAYTLPASDGTNGQAITTDGSGTLSFTTLGDGEVVKIHCKNTSGATIAKGTPVYITGNVGNSDRLEIAPADASDSAKMPAVGLLDVELTNDAEGDIIVNGYIKGVVTDTIDGTSGSSNDTVYVKSGGGLTLTKPTGTNLIQNIAKVARVHGSSGSLVVTSIMRTNDVPNIAEDHIWLGNSSGVATATEHLLNNVKDVTTSSPTDGQVLTWDNDNSYWKNADASGGSGSGTITIEKNIFTATAAQEDFTISSAPDSVNNLQVYLNGVYQAKDNYTVSGTTVTINTGTGVAVGTEVEIIHLKAVSGIIMVDAFTGDGTTTFNLTLSNANENHTQIYLDGVYQSKDNYSIVGKVITFTTAPPTGTAIEVVHIKAVDTSSLNINTFTGNGSTTDFTLSESIEDENKTFVFVQGVYQEKSNYSVSGTTLSFLTAPPNGFSIEVMAVGTVSFTTVSNANDAKYTPNLISSATTAVAGNLYVFTSSATLTLPASPSNGDTVKISNRSNTETCVVARNSSKIMGLAEDMTIDTAFASFELIYSGSTQGWVII